jgi:uncharacterized protein (DUF2344 family)
VTDSLPEYSIPTAHVPPHVRNHFSTVGMTTWQLKTNMALSFSTQVLDKKNKHDKKNHAGKNRKHVAKKKTRITEMPFLLQMCYIII